MVAWVSADDLASFEMYLPPPACDGRLDGRLIPLGPALFLVVVPRHADGAVAGGGAARRRAADAPPLLDEHAPTMTAVTATACGEPANVHARFSPPPMTLTSSGGARRLVRKRCFRRVGYIVRQTPFMPVAVLPATLTCWNGAAASPSGARQVEGGVAAAEPGRRVGQQRLERHLGRADERRVDPERRRDDADERPRAPAGRTGSSSASMASRTSGYSRLCGPPRITSRGLRMLTSPASPMPSQRPTCAMAAIADSEPASASAQDGVDAGATRVGRMTGQREQLALADLGLPAADASRSGRRRRRG